MTEAHVSADRVLLSISDRDKARPACLGISELPYLVEMRNRHSAGKTTEFSDFPMLLSRNVAGDGVQEFTHRVLRLKVTVRRIEWGA